MEKLLTDEQIKKKLSDRNLAEIARRLNCSRAWISAHYTGTVKISETYREKYTEYFREHG